MVTGGHRAAIWAALFCAGPCSGLLYINTRDVVRVTDDNYLELTAKQPGRVVVIEVRCGGMVSRGEGS